jgi:hypothetical protein
MAKLELGNSDIKWTTQTVLVATAYTQDSASFVLRPLGLNRYFFLRITA